MRISDWSSDVCSSDLPIDWPELSRAIRFGRANGRCEHCHRPHGQRVFHLRDGRWWDMDRRQWRDGRGERIRVGAVDLVAIVRITRVYLACAHFTHHTTDKAPRYSAAPDQRPTKPPQADYTRPRPWLSSYRRPPWPVRGW